MSKYIETIDRIASDVVRKNAEEVDRSACFPQAGLRALSEAGLLGLISAREVGGLGEGPDAAAAVVERLARECGSTAMVTTMHYAATQVVEAFGTRAQREKIAQGGEIGTLAFSEAGSRSHFWAPVSSATKEAGGVRLNATKSWVTSANHATFYVWSSQPMAAEGASTLWLVEKGAHGLSSAGAFDGLGLRGNDSTRMTAEDLTVPQSSMLGEDGGGLAIMLETVLPIFNVMTASVAVGLMEGATTAACAHAGATKHQHLGSSLAELPTIRAYLARMRIATDQARLLVADTVEAMKEGRADTMLRVLQAKAAAGEAATSVLDLAMRVCGGAAFRREVGVERRFRDARAGTVMAPTTDQLYDFIGKAICGLPVF